MDGGVSVWGAEITYNAAKDIFVDGRRLQKRIPGHVGRCDDPSRLQSGRKDETLAGRGSGGGGGPRWPLIRGWGDDDNGVDGRRGPADGCPDG